MKTLARPLESPRKGATDFELLNHLFALRRGVQELSKAIKDVEEELGERRATRFREGVKRG